jgi:hypothetical protein
MILGCHPTRVGSFSSSSFTVTSISKIGSDDPPGGVGKQWRRLSNSAAEANDQVDHRAVSRVAGENDFNDCLKAKIRTA